ncbi:uncharacterized protein LOC128548287 [Mercenaria mercenaria]|uniref:uncharacterized protein LOC128548287 n=1 Tax=Mercenaria mercenaria TaxID=6596 RepID=UPI00234E3BC7|nr:uncharacterized protein LOC128548287 [Mercenaria mercenaria]
MTKNFNCNLSEFTYAALDCIGCSKDNVNCRAGLYKFYAEKSNEVFKRMYPVNVDTIIAGSRGEGVVQLYESDVDVMYVFRNFLCVDSGSNQNGLTVIKAHFSHSPPGYTKLIPLDMTSELLGMGYLMQTTVYDLNEGHILISSSCFRNMFEAYLRIDANINEGIRKEIKPNSGPSVPISFFNDGISPYLNSLLFESDSVYTLPYLSSTIPTSWKERDRKHQWPSHDIIQEVSEMEGFVVPVGPQYSEEQNFEWRICYTTGEQILVSQLSAVQLKLYMLMKMFFKKIISKESHLVTSYMVKNIVFWVVEGNDSNMFTINNIIDMLFKCLAFVRECLYSNYLPNYMIPSRNLLYGKGNPHEKVKLRRFLTDLLNEGAIIVLRLEKVRSAMFVLHRNPEAAKQYCVWRTNVENIRILGILLLVSKLSPPTMFQRTMVVDAAVGCLANPLFYHLGFALLRLLNVNLLDAVTDTDTCMRRINNMLTNLFS